MENEKQTPFLKRVANLENRIAELESNQEKITKKLDTIYNYLRTNRG